MGDKSPRSIGLPMLIVVFTSICLFSFSGIAYSMARSSFLRCQDTMKRTTDYYEACNEAEKFLHSLENIPEVETTYEFTFGPAMDELQVTIVPDESETGFHIKSWILADTASWEAPESAGQGGGATGPQAPGAAASPEGPQAPSGGGSPEGPQAPSGGGGSPEGPQAPSGGGGSPEGPQAPSGGGSPEGPQPPASN